MRKLNLLLLVIGLILGSVTVYGQATQGSEPIPLTGATCVDDALHPIAGKTYSYTTTFNPDGGMAKWWTTKDVNFISAGADNSGTALQTPQITAVSNYNTDTKVSGGSSTTELIWSTDILGNTVSGTNPTFVVVKYDAPTGSCANNLKVYQIDPINAFTVDVLNMTDAMTPMVDAAGEAAYGDVFSSCVSNVAAATYSTTANAMVYDYGDNELFFEVIAANFSGSYTPTFQLTGLQDGQTADINWSYDTSYNTNLATGVSGATWSQTGAPVSTSVTDTHEGVSIYVKVTVHNGTYETLATQNISLAVTGQNTAGDSDIKNEDCNTEASFADNIANQELNPRPTVTNNTTGGDFVPKN